MEVQDGFIVGIFNYCDRWCERCPFTPRCRVFADVARYEAIGDSGFQRLLEAPPHPQDVHEPPAWMADIVDEINKATEEAERPAGTATVSDLESELPAPYAVTSTRANEYASRVYDWQRKTHPDRSPNGTGPFDVVMHFATLIPAKIYRALSGLADFDGDREFPPDHEGSAKVALLAIDESLAAWAALTTAGAVTAASARAFASELQWLRSELQAAIPLAAAFVRPGFDEPDAVKQLEASGE
jgi:hypothetical protein